jgi:hypothetical protein
MAVRPLGLLRQYPGVGRDRGSLISVCAPHGFYSMTPVSPPPIDQQGIDRFRARAHELRAEAELTTLPTVRQELLETALAYERMAERGERWLGGGIDPP